MIFAPFSPATSHRGAGSKPGWAARDLAERNAAALAAAAAAAAAAARGAASADVDPLTPKWKNNEKQQVFDHEPVWFAGLLYLPFRIVTSRVP